MAAFKWTDGKILAAKLLWEGRLTGAQIAEQCGVCRQVLDKWKTKPEFRARLAQYSEEYRACLRQQMRLEAARRLAEAVQAVRIDLRPRQHRSGR
jgi:hypothetical protein